MFPSRRSNRRSNIQINNTSSKQTKKKKISKSKCYFLTACLQTLIISLLFLINYNFYMTSKDTNNKIDIKISTSDDHKIKERNDEVITIAYAISITSCPNATKDQKISDGAAILKHSIHLSSLKSKNSRYTYEMIAIIHPTAMTCAKDLSSLGYKILERDTPIQIHKIQSQVLREGIVRSGCCQEKELIKLWAYTLTSYPVVVHLDLDTLVLQPMDELFDAMIYGSSKDVPVMFNKALPLKINAYFTRDYNMARPGKPHVGVQGGFFIVRPNTTVFQEYIDTIYTSRFIMGKGWGGKGFGNFYGAQQIQGLLPYYYDFLHPNEAVELNRCYYNAMGDNPRVKTTDGSLGKCKDTNTLQCEDCRDTPFDKIKSVHFTLCQKPWMCRYSTIDKKWRDYCNFMHHSWFRVRKSLEEGWKEEFGFRGGRKGDYRVDHFYGFCTFAGVRGYLPLVLPKELGGVD